ncbi:MAG: hypothetical protein WCN98_05060 [Verrucomicrobiaceae bacterium]
MREVFWVTRAKDNLRFRVLRRLQPGLEANILRDDLIRLSNTPSQKAYPGRNAPGERPRRGGWPSAPDGVVAQQPDLERTAHRRILSLPLEHRSVVASRRLTALIPSGQPRTLVVSFRSAQGT